MSEPFTETITDHDLGYKIRVWCLLPKDYNEIEQNRDILDTITHCLGLNWNTRRELAELIANAYPRITAVEVKQNGCGVVYYKDWP